MISLYELAFTKKGKFAELQKNKQSLADKARSLRQTGREQNNAKQGAFTQMAGAAKQLKADYLTDKIKNLHQKQKKYV